MSVQEPFTKKWQFWALLGGIILVLGLAIASLFTIFRPNTPAEPVAAVDIVAEVTSTPMPEPIIMLSPLQGKAYTAITVQGENWLPQEDLSIFLENPFDASGKRQAVGTIKANGEGQINTTIEYPDQPEWTGLTEALVVVTGSDNRMATATFLVIPSLATATAVIPVSNVLAGVLAETKTDLYLRRGPSTAYKVLNLVPQSTEITVLGQNEQGTWLLVRLADGSEGWVNRAFTTFDETVAIIVPQVQPQPTPTLLPPPIPITEWRGEYWANSDLAGTPAVVRNDNIIEFSWGNGSPDPIIPLDNFSARWVRTIDFPQGTYLFHVAMDDGARLWVDGQLLIDEWRDGGFREATAQISLAQGTHSIAVAYYERSGDARIRAWWGRINNPIYPNWKGEYWTNRNLSGEPALVRNDETINFDWGTGAPAPALTVSEYSVRWSRWLDLQPGRYRFQLQADDGIRMSIDQRRVLDEWHDSDGRQTYTFERDLGGAHWVVIEYYNNQGKALAKMNRDRIGDLATATPTVIAAPTETPVVSPTATATATPTETSEATPTETPVVEPTATETPIVTPTETPVVEPTATETPIIEPTATETATLEPTATETPIVEPTATETVVATLTPPVETAQPPSAVITGPATATVGEELTFEATASQPGSSEIVSYAWDFGDGVTDDTGPVVSHTYSEAGAYSVQLTITDANGLTSQAEQEVQVTTP